LASERHVIIAGAGIGGLTAALALARAGLRVTVLDQAPRLEEVGAGIQLSPNASRVLAQLGVAERLRVTAIEPQAIRAMSGGFGREIVRIPLGATAERRYGAPYWTVHRGDLQLALADAVRATQDITLQLATRIEDFATHKNGVTVQGRRAGEVIDARGMALIGADGIWSTVRERLRRHAPPVFRHRVAWRALVPAPMVAAPWREMMINLWLGQDAHLVHYPVKGGAMVNIVAIVNDQWKEGGWSATGDRDEIMRHFGRFSWCEAARQLVMVPDRWQKWALYDRPSPYRAGSGPVTLLGDAAHPMLPFLAQGGAMAIEDAAVLAAVLSGGGDNPAKALRAYERARRKRTATAQKAARKQARIYGLTGPEALIRNMVMRAKGGEKLLGRYDWLYAWRPPKFESPNKYVAEIGEGETE
jgi:salicylate hydroxylase